MSCAHATLGNVGDCIDNLCKAMECGIDCFSTVRADMDLANVSNTLEFTHLMDEFDQKGVERGRRIQMEEEVCLIILLGKNESEK